MKSIRNDKYVDKYKREYKYISFTFPLSISLKDRGFSKATLCFILFWQRMFLQWDHGLKGDQSDHPGQDPPFPSEESGWKITSSIKFDHILELEK